MKDYRPDLVRMLADKGFTVSNPDAMPKAPRAPRNDDGLRAMWGCLARDAIGRELTILFWNTPAQCVLRGFTVSTSVFSSRDLEAYADEKKSRATRRRMQSTPGPCGPSADVRPSRTANGPPTPQRGDESMPNETNPSIDFRTLVLEDLDAHMGAVSVPVPSASWVGHSFLNVQPHELDMRRRLITEDALRAQRKASVLLACVAALNALRDGRPDLAARALALLDGLSVEQWTARELARPR